MDEPSDAQAEMDNLLATYRERKRKAVEASRAPASMPGPAPVPEPAFAASPPASVAMSAEPEAPPMQAPASDPAMPAQPPPRHGAVVPHVPPQPVAAQPLSALGPVLRLSEALRQDKVLSVRGWRTGRLLGMTLLLLGLGLLAASRRQALLAGDDAVGGVSLFLPAAALFLLGGLLAIVFAFLPPSRRLAVRLAPTQAEEWGRVQKQAGRLAVLNALGVTLAVLGLLGAAAAYGLPSLEGTAAPIVLFAVAAAGLALLAYVLARRSLARRLYVQTLVLSGLERTGIGAPDGRVAPVLLALDELLGTLPEAEVKRFLDSPQAQAYLDLIDEAGRSHGR